MRSQRRPIGLSVPYRRVEEDDDIQDYKKSWRWLTDKEIWQLVNDCTIGGDLHADKFAKAIEIKVKENNGG